MIFLKKILYLIYFPVFLLEIIFFKITKKNSESCYQKLIKYFCLFGGVINSIVHEMLNFKKVIFIKELEINNFNKIDEFIVLQKLNNDGFFLTNEFNGLNKDKTEKILKFMKSSLGFYQSDNYSSSKMEILNLEEPKATSFLIPSNEAIKCKELQEIIISSKILNIVQNYLDSFPIIDFVNVLFTFPNDQSDSKIAQKWHFDMDRARWIKLFIFLNDVTELNGPHNFISKTHKYNGIPNLIRHKGYARIEDEEINKLELINNINKFTCKAGSLLFEDTIGLHKGENVKKGYRAIVTIQYTSCLFGSNNIKKNSYPKEFSKNFDLAIKKYPELFLNFK